MLTLHRETGREWESHARSEEAEARVAAVSGHLWEIEDTDFVVEQVRNMVLIFFLIMQLNTLICQDRLGMRKREETKTEENGRVI